MCLLWEKRNIPVKSISWLLLLIDWNKNLSYLFSYDYHLHKSPFLCLPYRLTDWLPNVMEYNTSLSPSAWTSEHLLFFNDNFKTSRYLQLLYKYSRSRFHQGPEQKENTSLSFSIRDHTIDVADGLEKEGGLGMGKEVGYIEIHPHLKNKNQ